MTTNKYNETEELLGFNTVWKDFCRAKFHKYDEQTNNLQKYNINNIWSKNISNKLYVQDPRIFRVLHQLEGEQSRVECTRTERTMGE